MQKASLGEGDSSLFKWRPTSFSKERWLRNSKNTLTKLKKSFSPEPLGQFQPNFRYKASYKAFRVLSRTTGPISTKLGTKHPWAKGIKVCSNHVWFSWRWFQNNRGQVNICVCISYSVSSNPHTAPVRIYGEMYAHKFCAVEIFWNINSRQAISPVAKFHHMLGRGFRIQWVILIFIKCLSANQNQLFYKTV